MKFAISKLEAAQAQLVTAIQLFFEERDSISIHTLTCAALNILHDHIVPEDAWKHDIFLHYNSIYVKDEARKLYAEKVREAANFFKHADRDLKAGKVELEFNPDMTKFHIIEALNCLGIIEPKKIDWPAEFGVFNAWFLLKHPHLVKEEAKRTFPPDFYNTSPDDFAFFREALKFMKENPDLLRRKA